MATYVSAYLKWIRLRRERSLDELSRSIHTPVEIISQFEQYGAAATDTLIKSIAKELDVTDDAIQMLNDFDHDWCQLRQNVRIAVRPGYGLVVGANQSDPIRTPRDAEAQAKSIAVGNMHFKVALLVENRISVWFEQGTVVKRTERDSNGEVRCLRIRHCDEGCPWEFDYSLHPA